MLCKPFVNRSVFFTRSGDSLTTHTRDWRYSAVGLLDKLKPAQNIDVRKICEFSVKQRPILFVLYFDTIDQGKLAHCVDGIIILEKFFRPKIWL